MTARQDAIERLQANLAKQQSLVGELAMWAKVEAQGIDPETVATFTLWEAFLSAADKKRRRTAELYSKPDPFVRGRTVLVYNAVRLKDGTLKQLDPMIERPGV